MKRLFLLFSLVLSLGLSAKVTIQSTFNGCTLGKSTQSEVLVQMLVSGADVVDYDESSITFKGAALTADGIEFGKCITTYIEDTLHSLLFVGNTDKISAVQVKAIKTMYEPLKRTAENDFMLQTSQKILCEKWNIDSTHVWARGDEYFDLMIIENDTLICFDYQASQYLQEYTKRKVRATNVNYNETNAVKSVAGCEFGDTKQNVTAKFRSKTKDCIDVDAHSITYSGVSFGGHYFKRGTLYFKHDKFVACTFETEFYTWKYEEAKATYESICSQYNRKYTNGQTLSNDSDKMISFYGMLQSDYEDGTLPPIIISMKKGVSRGGDTYYYVTVSYFQERLKALYDDEI